MYEYRILNRNNDMAKDILDTIKNQSDNDMKVFLNRLYKNDVVFLYPDDYDLIAKLSDDEVEEIYEKKGYILDTEEFLYLINVYSGKDYDKLRERMKQERLYFDYYGVSNLEYKFLNLCYKVLEDDDIFDKFLDFDNHLELFSLNNSFLYLKKNIFNRLV